MEDSRVSTREITAEDAPQVAEFLNAHLNSRVSVDAWTDLIRPPWVATGPNHGFQLVSDDGAIVGAYVAVYSTRQLLNSSIDVCNLAAFCVIDGFRPHSLKLLRALLRQPGLLFTDLSPSGNVVALNERLGFQTLDSATRLIVNLPAIASRGVRVTEKASVIERALVGRDAEIYRDHRDAAAAEHLLVQQGEEYAYLMYRRDRRRGLRLFATPLYLGGSRSCWERGSGAVRSRLLRRGIPFTLAEHRIVGSTHGLGVEISGRPKMFRGEGIRAEDVDYLYSELALVSW